MIYSVWLNDFFEIFNFKKAGNDIIKNTIRKFGNIYQISGKGVVINTYWTKPRPDGVAGAQYIPRSILFSIMVEAAYA